MLVVAPAMSEQDVKSVEEVQDCHCRAMLAEGFPIMPRPFSRVEPLILVPEGAPFVVTKGKLFWPPVYIVTLDLLEAVTSQLLLLAPIALTALK